MRQREQKGQPARTESDAGLRVSDRERERVVEALSAHAGQGRLSFEELEARVDRAHAARTRGELAALTADLPGGERGEHRARSPRRTRRLRPDSSSHVVAFVVVNVLLVAIWAVSGGGYFWPLWPILGWGLGLARPGGCGRRRGATPGSRIAAPADSKFG